MNKRRSLTPDVGLPNVQPRAQARRGGARRTTSDRVTFRSESGQIREGWALNVSRGGLRAILDVDPDDVRKVELGDEFTISVGAADAGDAALRGRIVWLQEEPDGFVVGVEYLTPSGKHAAAPSSVPQPSSASPPWVPPPPVSAVSVESGSVEASGVNPASEARVRADSVADVD